VGECAVQCLGRGPGVELCMKGKGKNTAYVGGLARRRDVEVVVVELGGDALVRAGTRGICRRLVERKQWKRAPGQTSEPGDEATPKFTVLWPCLPGLQLPPPPWPSPRRISL
jgi:hypothetical protein